MTEPAADGAATHVQVVDAPGDLREPLDPKRSGIAAGLLVLAFFLFVFVTSSDRVLAGYHRPNESGYGPTLVTGGPGGGGWLSADDFKDRVDTWRGFECSNRAAAPPPPSDVAPSRSEPCPDEPESPFERWRDPNRPLEWFFIGDLVFALVATAGLTVLWTAFRSRRVAEEDAHRARVDDARRSEAAGGAAPTIAPLEGALRSSRWVLAAILALGASDVLEDLVIGLQARATLNGTSPSALWVFVGMFFGWVKWLLVLALALVFLLSAFGGLWRRRRDALARIWAAALIALVVALLVRVPQTEDGLRSINVFQLAGSLLLAVLVGTVGALAGSRALEHHRDAYVRGAPSRPDVPPGVYGFTYGSSRWSGWRLAVVGAGLTLLGIVPWLRGLVVPGLVLVVLFALSVVIHPKYTLPAGSAPPRTKPLDDWSPVFWAAALVWALTVVLWIVQPGSVPLAVPVIGIVAAVIVGLVTRRRPSWPWSIEKPPSSDTALRRSAPGDARQRELNDWSRTAGALGAAVPMLVTAGAVTAFTVDPLPRSLGRDATVGLVLLLLALVLFGAACTLATFWLSRKLIGALSARVGDDPATRIARQLWARAATVVIGGVAAIVLVVARSDHARTISQTVGSMTVVLAFAFVLAAIAVLCRTGSDVLVRFPSAVPASLRSLRVRRPPLLFGLLVWLVLASFIGQGHAHDVRRLSSPPPDRQVADGAGGTTTVPPDAGVPVAAYTKAWRERAIAQVDPATADTATGTDAAFVGGSAEADPATPPDIPVVLVATSGGGIRASYWTSAVLDCLFERTPDPQPAPGASTAPDHCERSLAATDGSPGTHRRPFLFALSGVSGGSLGIVEWLAYLEQNPTEVGERQWFDETQRRDFLAPTLATMLLVDGPDLFLRNQGAGNDDRGAALEQGWEDAWIDYRGTSPLAEGFATAQQSLDEPIALLSSSSVADGCRFNVTVLDLATTQESDDAGLNSGCRGLAEGSVLPGSIDLTDWTFCNGGHDIRRSTAALLSARFPYVTPSGWLDGCEDNARTFLVDGGYLETSGASALVALWNNGVRPVLCPDASVHCRFVPVFVQIDNDPADSIGPLPPAKEEPASPNELLVPPSALQSASGGWANASRASACLEFNTASSDGYWLRLSVGQQPGAPPPLGWVLSDQTREALRMELNRTDNAARIEWLHDWLDHPDAGPAADAPVQSC